MEETEWPHMTKCAPLKKTGDKCADDFQCPISHFCWYQGSSDVENGIKRCMEMYTMKNGEDFGWSSVTHSQGGVTDDIEDFERNGKACKTGLAYNAGDNKAVCVSADKVTFRDSVIYEPYPCSPRDPNDKCHIVYKKEDGSEGFAQTDCKCAMIDFESGFCGSVIGTDVYATAVAAKKELYDVSKCHTLDRDNFRAHRDTCGIGQYDNKWENAVQTHFNVTHWPYI